MAHLGKRMKSIRETLQPGHLYGVDEALPAPTTTSITSCAVCSTQRVSYSRSVKTPTPLFAIASYFTRYHVATNRGLAATDFVAMVESLNNAVARVDGRGFSVTPFAPADALGERLGVAAGRLWVKDETGNVSGSHKGGTCSGWRLA